MFSLCGDSYALCFSSAEDPASEDDFKLGVAELGIFGHVSD